MQPLRTKANPDIIVAAAAAIIALVVAMQLTPQHTSNFGLSPNPAIPQPTQTVRVTSFRLNLFAWRSQELHTTLRLHDPDNTLTVATLPPPAMLQLDQDLATRGFPSAATLQQRRWIARSINIAHLLLAFAAGAATMLALAHRRRRQRLQSARCDSCNDDLAGLDTTTCPECDRTNP